jgi:hypothetical protein
LTSLGDFSATAVSFTVTVAGIRLVQGPGR